MLTPPLECSSLPPVLAPCEHIAGNEKFIRKAFALQARHTRKDGTSLVDVTLDLEDGAPVGQEEPLRQLFASLLTCPENGFKQAGVRIHPPHSSHCVRDIQEIISAAGTELAYLTVPKVRSVRDVQWCIGVARHYLRARGIERFLPFHVLIETPEALAIVEQIAAIPEVQVLDLGLMDFISHAGGLIPATCMASPGQFEHHLILQAKTMIASAALAANKIASHNVTTNVRAPEQAFRDARTARDTLGFLRMWSIHPDQVEPIIRGMTPSREEALKAKAIIDAAQAAHWGPVEYQGVLHDRASYRYYWGILTRSEDVEASK